MFVRQLTGVRIGPDYVGRAGSEWSVDIRPGLAGAAERVPRVELTRGWAVPDLDPGTVQLDLMVWTQLFPAR